MKTARPHMPTTSFSMTVPGVTPEQAWQYCRNYANTTQWAPGVEVTPVEGSDSEWVVHLTSWRAFEVTCTRQEDDAPHDDNLRRVRFHMRSASGAVRSTEEFYIGPHGEGGCFVSYVLLLGLSGWRRLPCIGAVVWVGLRSEAASTQRALERRLLDLAKYNIDV